MFSLRVMKGLSWGWGGGGGGGEDVEKLKFSKILKLFTILNSYF